jgi:hypothetical protein
MNVKHYLTKDHIDLLNRNLKFFPKYGTFDLKDISTKISENDTSYSGWVYLFSKITQVHGDIFNDLYLNGFIEFLDTDKGTCRLTADGQKLKDFGDYESYLKYLNLDYSAKRQENIVKKFWWVWAIISFFAGLFINNCSGFIQTTMEVFDFSKSEVEVIKAEKPKQLNHKAIQTQPLRSTDKKFKMVDKD